MRTFSDLLIMQTMGVKYTDEQKKWLADNYDLFSTRAELTREFNRIFSQSRTVQSINDIVIKRLKLGRKGPNVTSFGNKTKEQLPLGTVRTTQNRTYIKVKMVGIDEPKITAYKKPWWIPLAEYEYIRQGGEIPKGHFIIHLDGNVDSLDISNLYPITRTISIYLSKNRMWSKNPEITKTAILLAELNQTIKNK